MPKNRFPGASLQGMVCPSLGSPTHFFFSFCLSSKRSKLLVIPYTCMLFLTAMKTVHPLFLKYTPLYLYSMPVSTHLVWKLSPEVISFIESSRSLPDLNVSFTFMPTIHYLYFSHYFYIALEFNNYRFTPITVCKYFKVMNDTLLIFVSGT